MSTNELVHAPLTDSDVLELASGQDVSDISGLSLDELVGCAREHREAAEWHYGQAKHHWLELGRYLICAKARLPHGEFMSTVPTEVGISYARAAKAMFVARNLAGTLTLPPEAGLDKLVQAVQETKRSAAVAQQAIAQSSKPDVELPPDCTIEVGDAVDLPLPDDSVDLIVTSPPYGLGIEYADTDDNEGYEVYMQHVFAWAVEMARVARAQGRLCLNVPLDVTYGGTKPIYADWVQALTDAGWKYRATIIWNEDNVSKSTARGSVDSPSSPHVFARVETIIVMHKGEWNLHRADEHNLTHEQWLAWTNGTWTFGGEHRKDHPAPFPEELPRRCITLLSFKGDVVLDPFVGSGTTCVAAAKLGRTAYGFDHSPQYVQSARARLAEALGTLG